MFILTESFIDQKQYLYYFIGATGFSIFTWILFLATFDLKNQEIKEVIVEEEE